MTNLSKQTGQKAAPTWSSQGRRMCTPWSGSSSPSAPCARSVRSSATTTSSLRYCTSDCLRRDKTAENSKRGASSVFDDSRIDLPLSSPSEDALLLFRTPDRCDGQELDARKASNSEVIIPAAATSLLRSHCSSSSAADDADSEEEVEALTRHPSRCSTVLTISTAW